MINLLIVAAGGALGAAGRYAVGLLPVKTDFPLLTLLVNAAGAVIIGFLAGLFARGGLTDRRLLFWKTGVCGGFTTFPPSPWRLCSCLKRAGTWPAASTYC